MKKNNIHQGPHKFQHLAKQGFSLEAISEALTHSDKEITKTYVNTKDIVNQTVGEIAFRILKLGQEISGNYRFLIKRHPREISLNVLKR